MWKETVMSGEEMSEQIQIKTKRWSVCNPEFIEDIAGIISQSQAEITGEIAYNKGYDKGYQQALNDRTEGEGRVVIKPVSLEKLIKESIEKLIEESIQTGRKQVAKSILATIENSKQVNYRLKEITEYCESQLDTTT